MTNSKIIPFIKHGSLSDITGALGWPSAEALTMRDFFVPPYDVLPALRYRWFDS